MPQVPKGLTAEDQRIAERLERLHKVNQRNAPNVTKQTNKRLERLHKVTERCRHEFREPAILTSLLGNNCVNLSNFQTWDSSAFSGVIVPIMLQERKDRDQLPSEDEVRARLNRLKGVEYSSDNRAQQADQKGHQAQFYQHPDARTATEQVQHLVTATSAKVVTAHISHGVLF